MAWTNQSRSQTQCARLYTDDTIRAQSTTPNHLRFTGVTKENNARKRVKDKEEENDFNKDEKKMIRHFKKIAQGLKKEGCKYNWLEKPKTFDGTHSKYWQFKQLVQWYLYI
jgi:hypothetical protein